MTARHEALRGLCASFLFRAIRCIRRPVGILPCRSVRKN